MSADDEGFLPPGVLVVLARPALADVRVRIVQVLRWASTALPESGYRPLQEAVALMVEVHADQVRRDDKPYLDHTLGVVERVLAWVREPASEVLIAALLHDAVEDGAPVLAARITATGSERERALLAIEYQFGARVRALLTLLSNPVAPGARYAEHVLHALDADPDVATVKLADIACNGLDLGALPDETLRGRLRNKYAPVIRTLPRFLARLSPSHPLYGCREHRIREVQAAWDTHYAPFGCGDPHPI